MEASVKWFADLGKVAKFLKRYNLEELMDEVG